jgi:hypothetical protein
VYLHPNESHPNSANRPLYHLHSLKTRMVCFLSHLKGT